MSDGFDARQNLRQLRERLFDPDFVSEDEVNLAQNVLDGYVSCSHWGLFPMPSPYSKLFDELKRPYGGPVGRAFDLPDFRGKVNLVDPVVIPQFTIRVL